MNVKELYESINGDYQRALSVMMSDSLIERMINKFMANELYEIAAIITEATRNGATPNLDKEIAILKERYQRLENSYQKYR